MANILIVDDEPSLRQVLMFELKYHGYSIVEAYRKKKPEQKVILMTGYALDERFEKARKAGLIHCLRKPFELTELESTISKLCP